MCVCHGGDTWISGRSRKPLESCIHVRQSTKLLLRWHLSTSCLCRVNGRKASRRNDIHGLKGPLLTVNTLKVQRSWLDYTLDYHYNGVSGVWSSEPSLECRHVNACEKNAQVCFALVTSVQAHTRRARRATAVTTGSEARADRCRKKIRTTSDDRKYLSSALAPSSPPSPRKGGLSTLERRPRRLQTNRIDVSAGGAGGAAEKNRRCSTAGEETQAARLCT